jgi:RhtB (resistance to homoserine/threonine) family protein
MLDSPLVLYIAVAGLLVITPGADTMLVARNVLAGGRAAGLLTTLGIATGCMIHGTLSALGLSVILARSATAFEVVKVAGAIYLVIMGVQSLRRWWSGGAPPALPGPTASRSRAFLEGLLTNLLNPEVAIFYLAFLPQFVGPSDPLLATSLLLAGIHMGLGVLWLALMAVLLGRVRALVEASSLRRRLEAVTGVVLIGLGVRMALERR